jgi:hypothetical protein
MIVFYFKNALAYYIAGVVAVNLKVEGSAPGVFAAPPLMIDSPLIDTRLIDTPFIDKIIDRHPIHRQNY